MHDPYQGLRACMRMLVQEYSAPLAVFALGYAEAAHKGMYREGSGEPYIEHPARVACYLNVFPSGVFIAALLHDTVEDTRIDFDDLARVFPPEVVETVRVLTATEYPSKSAAIRAALRHPWASLVKVADRLDNIRSLEHVDRKKRLSFARITLESFVPEAEKCAERFSENRDFFERSVRLIKEMCERYLADA